MTTFFSFADRVLMQPYHVFGEAVYGFWFGTFCLAVLCVLVGRLTGALLYRLNKPYYEKENAELERVHELSIRAANAGDKEAFKAINRLANDSFGKNFFAGAALFSATLWPLPFALHWLSGRFEGVPVHVFPNGTELGYVFVMFACYIGVRLAGAWLTRKRRRILK